MATNSPQAGEGQVGMTSMTSVPGGQSDKDDWFNLDVYKKAAGVAFDYSKQKAQVAGEEERKGIATTGTEARKSEETRGAAAFDCERVWRTRTFNRGRAR